ncbi:MAG TPA: tRNA 4-thiouridine(8) synthase ThiI [Candidatus Edwardsbacteria bacterium]|nr:tRNA 4-thiouridine(8) synthase ThiI [Candidatus Edwardsbacteria bacterium]
MKCLALLSGGLDSMLAIKVVQAQGIEVLAIAFVTPFFGPSSARKAAKQLGVGLVEHDFTDAYFEMMKKPRYGFGGNMNPCIDCHGLMMRTAHGLLGKYGASFLITGEVLGERPMSQSKSGLNAVLKLAADRDLVLRPLSAKLLDPTKPEREGWVDRERLLGLSGRGRKPQVDLAQQYGITEYPQPAGGCLLTDVKFSQRLKELITHEGLVRADIELLTTGRHFRLGERTKFVIGRKQDENQRLLDAKLPGDLLLRPPHDVKGPVGLLRGPADDVVLNKAAMALCRYCDVAPGGRLAVNLYRPDGTPATVQVTKPGEDEVAKWMI